MRVQMSLSLCSKMKLENGKLDEYQIGPDESFFFCTYLKYTDR